MNARELTKRLGGRWHRSYGLARCPAHDDREPSLSIQAGETAPLVTCHAGCDRRDVIAALHRSGLWEASDGGRQHRSRPRGDPAPSYPGPAEGHDYARQLWQYAREAAGTPVETYLRNRGLTDTPPPTLRYQPALKYTPSGLHLPGMVAAVQASDRRLVALHRTFLRLDGRGKAQVASPRMWLGAFGDGAIRLAPAAPELGIGEGIETCLAAMELSGVGAWAAGSANRLAHVALPSEVEHVHVFRDADAEGAAGANAAAQRFTAEGRRVTVHSPPDGCNDFANVIEAEAGQEVV